MISADLNRGLNVLGMCRHNHTHGGDLVDARIRGVEKPIMSATTDLTLDTRSQLGLGRSGYGILPVKNRQVHARTVATLCLERQEGRMTTPGRLESRSACQDAFHGDERPASCHASPSKAP